MNDEFWYHNPSILFQSNRLMDFFPAVHMNQYEKLNAISRLSAYLTMVLFVYSGNYLYLFITIITLIITYLIFIQNDDVVEEKFDTTNNLNLQIIEPTNENPFMNILLDDWEKTPNREAINKLPNANIGDIQETINDKFNKNLYRDLGDVFEKENSQRQFYTTPITTIPNNQDKFAKWLYYKSETCKEGNGNQCYVNNHNPPSNGSR